MMPEWTAFPVGIIFASFVTMIGAGGGILWTPYLIFVMGLNPTQAVLSSLLIQIAGMGSAGIAAIMKKNVDPKIALILAAVGFPGVCLGVWLQTVINPGSLVFLLGVSTLATSLVFVYAREEFDFIPVRDVAWRSLIPYLWVVPGFSVLTGLLSIGVGDYLIPILRNRLGMRMGSAIGACLILMSINAACAATLHLVRGESFPAPLVMWAAAGVMIGGQIGPRLAARVKDQTLKEIFIYVLAMVGIHVLFKA